MFDFASLSGGEGFSHNRVVTVQQSHGVLIPQVLRERSRVDDVSEQDSANRGIQRGNSGSNEDRAFLVGFATTQKHFRQLRLHFDNFFRYKSVRLAMDLGRCFRTRRLDQAKSPAAALVDPVLVIFDSVLFLRLEVRLVDLRHLARRDSGKLVDVHEVRHNLMQFE